MKKINLSLTFDAEKLAALEQYLAKKNLRLADELESNLQKLYTKHVPPLVQEYIESRSGQSVPDSAKTSRTKPVG